MKTKLKVGDGQKWDIQLSELSKYELSPLPSPLFDEYGDMRKGNKSILVSKLAVIEADTLTPVDAELVDGNEAICRTLWPKHATLKSFAKAFVQSDDNKRALGFCAALTTVTLVYTCMFGHEEADVNIISYY